MTDPRPYLCRLINKIAPRTVLSCQQANEMARKFEKDTMRSLRWSREVWLMVAIFLIILLASLLAG